jgi:hypothetical protein
MGTSERRASNLHYSDVPPVPLTAAESPAAAAALTVACLAAITSGLATISAAPSAVAAVTAEPSAGYADGTLHRR